MPVKRQNISLLDLELQHEKQTQKVYPHPILGIDFGEKYSGMAMSTDGILVLPREVVPTQNLTQKITAICQEKNIVHIVFGLPLASDNSENHICQKIRQYAQKVQKKISPSIKISFTNERHSSQVISSKRSPERIDDLAAVKIIEYFWNQS